MIIFPYDTELQDTLWDLYNLKSLLIIWVTFQENSQTSFQLCKSLQGGETSGLQVMDELDMLIPVRILVQLEVPLLMY
jgi:hypothetical protein